MMSPELAEKLDAGLKIFVLGVSLCFLVIFILMAIIYADAFVARFFAGGKEDSGRNKS